jgi:hypothetical protein
MMDKLQDLIGVLLILGLLLLLRRVLDSFSRPKPPPKRPRTPRNSKIANRLKPLSIFQLDPSFITTKS